jgi:hypothetical protein
MRRGRRLEYDVAEGSEEESTAMALEAKIGLREAQVAQEPRVSLRPNVTAVFTIAARTCRGRDGTLSLRCGLFLLVLRAELALVRIGKGRQW